MGIANVVASGIAPAMQGGFTAGQDVQLAEQQQEATKQSQQTTQERQLQLDQQQQIMPGDTYLKLAAQDYAKKEQDFINNIQQPEALQQNEAALQLQHQQVSQDASVYAFNQAMLGEGKQAADFVSKNKVLNPTGIQYEDTQILDANGQPTRNPDQAVTFRLLPQDKMMQPHDIPYATMANLSRMKGTSVVQGKDGSMLVQTISPAMNKGQPMITPAYTPTKISATREGDLYKETGPGADGQVLNNGGTNGQGPLTGGALAREQKTQGIIKDGNMTIFKTLGADAFGSLNPEQQPLAMRATYLYEKSVRAGKPITPAQAIAQAKQDLPALQKRGQPAVPTGFQPTTADNGTAEPSSDATTQARAAFAKILGNRGATPAASGAAPQPVTQPVAAPPMVRPPMRPPVAAPSSMPTPSTVSIMPVANAASAPQPGPASGVNLAPPQQQAVAAPAAGGISTPTMFDLRYGSIPANSPVAQSLRAVSAVTDAVHRGTVQQLPTQQLQLAVNSPRLNSYVKQSVIRELRARKIPIPAAPPAPGSGNIAGF
ncbi:MAG: hypothetical protein ACYC9K_00845 [Sulfuricaulis sp.]